MFGCISNKGYIPKDDGKVCLYNEDHNACNYGIGIGVLAFLASMGFLAGEYLFEQMSSVKTRKHFVLLDLGYMHTLFFLEANNFTVKLMLNLKCPILYRYILDYCRIHV